MYSIYDYAYNGLLYLNNVMRQSWLVVNLRIIMNNYSVSTKLFRLFFIQLKQLGHALAFSKGGLHGETEGLHDGTVVVLMGFT